MNAKNIALAAATLFVATGASAQGPAAKVHGWTAPRHGVIDNIVSRVQMDALIDSVVDSPVKVAAKHDWTVARTGDTDRGIEVAAVGNTARVRS